MRNPDDTYSQIDDEPDDSPCYACPGTRGLNGTVECTSKAFCEEYLEWKERSEDDNP